MSQDFYEIAVQSQSVDLYLKGRWTLANLSQIERQLLKDFKLAVARKPRDLKFTIHGSELEIVDTSAVLLLKKIQIKYHQTAPEMTVEFADMPLEYTSLSAKLAEFDIAQKHPRVKGIRSPLDILAVFGKACLNTYRSFAEMPQLLGLFVLAVIEIIKRPMEFRFTSMMFHVQQMTIPAIAIVFSVCFMVGAVLTEQVAWRLSIFALCAL